MTEAGGKWKSILWQIVKPALVAAIVALLVSMGYQMVQPLYPAGGAGNPRIDAAGTTHLSALAVTGDATVGTLAVTGNTELSGSLDVLSDGLVGGNLEVDGVLLGTSFGVWSPVTPVSVTMSVPITPTGSYQPLESAGTVSTTLAATGFTAGTWVCLVNTSNTTIAITDTGTCKLAGNWQGGQYDTLTVLFDGTNWVELGRSNN
jgi:hypothetical protein